MGSFYKGAHGLTYRALANILAEIASDQPMHFAQDASKFLGMSPEYITGLLRGWENAVQQKRELAWEPVLDLCERSLELPPSVRSEDLASTDEDFANEWRTLQLAVASLLTVGVEPERAMIPVIIERLAGDPHPAPDDEEQWSSAEPAPRALNAVRGMALCGVIAYALWIHHFVKGEGFTNIGEAAAMLDAHIDIGRDPALTVHVLFGRYFSKLAYLDLDWTRERVGVIFPEQSARGELREATWDAYLAFNRAYPKTFAILREEYRRAIDRIGQTDRGQHYRTDPSSRLTEHLMTLIWVGGLDADPPSETLVRFYTVAPDDLRAEGIAFLGRTLYRSEVDVSAEVAKRLCALWELRMEGTHPAGSKELSAFGWWYGSGKLDPSWALRQLEEVLKRNGGEIDVGYLVGEQLALRAPIDPLPVMRCLRLVVDGNLYGRRLELRQESVRAMLAAALQSNDEANRQAKVIVNLLAAQGLSQYRDLLSKQMSPLDASEPVPADFGHDE